MLGERLEQAQVTPLGLDGDRVLAVRDVGSGAIISAKRLAALFGYRVSSVNGTVVVAFPDSSEMAVDDPDLEDRLSSGLGRAISLVARDSVSDPLIEIGSSASTDEGPSQTFDGMPDTFFDSSPVHVLTNASLEAARSLDPTSDYDPRRFRPNILLETGGEGFVEQEWVGLTIAFGEVALRVVKPCGRCVMTTHAQSELAKERAVLETLARHNDNKLGVLCSVVSEGTVAVGDAPEVV